MGKVKDDLKDMKIYPIGTDKKLIYASDEDGTFSLSVEEGEGSYYGVTVNGDLSVDGDQAMIDQLKATTVYPFTDEHDVEKAAEEIAQNLNKIEDSNMNKMVEQSNLSKRIIDTDFNNEAILGISENYANLHTDDVRISSNEESVIFAGDDFRLQFNSNGSYSFTVDSCSESGKYETLKDINEILKSVDSIIEIGPIEDSIEEYSKDDLMKNPPKYARDLKVWEECVNEATDNGEKEVPIVKPILLYKDRMRVNDANSIQDMQNRINKEISKKHGDNIYISWNDDKGTIYVENYDIGELQIQNDGIKRIELWDKNYVKAFEDILKAINRVSDSITFNFSKTGILELRCRKGKLVVDSVGRHQIVKINGFKVADYYRGTLRVERQFTNRLYLPNREYKVSCSRFIKIIDSVSYPLFSIRKIEDSMDVRLLKTIVEANLEHYKVTADVSTSGNKVRVAQNGSVLATIETKDDGFEVQVVPSCPKKIKEALLEIRDEGEGVTKDEKTGGIKESFKKNIKDITNAFNAISKVVGKDAAQASVAIAGPVGVIASELISAFKNSKAEK
jgi:uncharacterized protein (DUF427 family)